MILLQLPPLNDALLTLAAFGLAWVVGALIYALLTRNDRKTQQKEIKP